MLLSLDVWTPDSGWGTISTETYQPHDMGSFAAAVHELANKRIKWIAMNIFPDAIWHIDLPGARRPVPRTIDAIGRIPDALQRCPNTHQPEPASMRPNDAQDKNDEEAHTVYSDGPAVEGSLPEASELPSTESLSDVRSLVQAEEQPTAV